MQSSRKNVRKAVAGFVLLAVVTYTLMSLFAHFFPPKYSNCQRYTQDLNGGVKTIGAKKYDVKMCGTGGDENSNDDEVELRVSDEKGELLAKRHFTVHWMANFHEPLEYQNDQVIYYDFSTHTNFKKSITMPPTAFDWIRARLPLY